MDEAVGYTGMLQLIVVDGNDNCPALKSTYQFHAIPVLGKQLAIVFGATDADTGVNAELMYFVSQPHIE